MILLVEAVDGDGNTLPLLSGQTIPEWGGVGDPAKGYYAGLPGKIYSKVLRELWTDIYPTTVLNPPRCQRQPAGSDESDGTHIF
jgi:hypothetical protein